LAASLAGAASSAMEKTLTGAVATSLARVAF